MSDTKPKVPAEPRKEKEPTSVPVTYAKSQLVASTRFSAVDRDILAFALSDGAEYTLEQAEAALRSYKHREVK